jgi:hypothetical protein
MQDSEVIIHRHHDAINEQNAESYIETIKFPFTYQNYNGISITIHNPDEYITEFDMPWDIIKKTEPNWSHSVLENLDEVARSKSSVVYKVLANRINKFGGSDLQIQAIWIAVFNNDSWGVQFRHNLGAPIQVNCGPFNK